MKNKLGWQMWHWALVALRVANLNEVATSFPRQIPPSPRTNPIPISTTDYPSHNAHPKVPIPNNFHPALSGVGVFGKGATVEFLSHGTVLWWHKSLFLFFNILLAWKEVFFDELGANFPNHYEVNLKHSSLLNNGLLIFW